jgi:DNA-binding transcriptional regulator YiaG
MYAWRMDALQLARVRRICSSGAARRIRESSRLSKAEVGRATGVSGAAVSRWEDGSRAPTGPEALRYLKLLEKLAAMTGSSLSDAHEST